MAAGNAVAKSAKRTPSGESWCKVALKMEISEKRQAYLKTEAIPVADSWYVSYTSTVHPTDTSSDVNFLLKGVVGDLSMVMSG